MFILQIILLAATAGLVTFSCLNKVEKKGYYNEIITKYDFTMPNVKKLLLAIVPIVLFVGTMCVTFVPANTVGIKYSAISGTSEDTLKEGMAFKSPLDRVYTISTTVQEHNVNNVSVQTRDAQYVTMSMNIKYSVNSSNAFKVFQNYKTLENLQASLIANAAQRAVEEVTTVYNVIEVLGEQRNKIYVDIENNLKERLAHEGVDLKFITITDTDAGEAIENAIQAEAIAKKAAETSLQKQEQAKIDAETKLMQAEIEAQTKLVEAQGEAEANAIKTNALTDKILMEMWINKWNGTVPAVSSSDGMMIDISGLME